MQAVLHCTVHATSAHQTEGLGGMHEGLCREARPYGTLHEVEVRTCTREV